MACFYRVKARLDKNPENERHLQMILANPEKREPQSTQKHGESF